MHTETSMPVDPSQLPPSERPSSTSRLRPQVLQMLLIEERVSINRLTSMLDAPSSSIRREIQVLRRQHHNISFAKDGVYVYTRA